MLLAALRGCVFATRPLAGAIYNEGHENDIRRGGEIRGFEPAEDFAFLRSGICVCVMRNDTVGWLSK